MNANRSSRTAAHRKKRKRQQASRLLLAAAVVLIIWGGYSYWNQRTDREAAQTPSTTEPPPSAASVEPSTPVGASGSPIGEEPTPRPSAESSLPSPVDTGGATASSNPSPSETAAEPIATGSPIPYEPGVFNDPTRVQMSFVGDVLLGSTVEKLLTTYGYDYPYRQILPYLKRADVTVADLETPITNGAGTKQDKQYVYTSSPSTLPAFKDAGFDLVNLANNHVMDYGVDGLLETFRHLEDQDISYVGAGRNAKEAFAPVIVERKGMKIAFFGFSRVVPDASWKAGASAPGVADTYNYTMPVEAIKQAKEQADLVVVIAHWGVERQDMPEDYQRELAHRFIDAGADLIVASHPHVLQGFERYKDKWIAYSLGNFIFTTNDVVKTWDSTVLEASCTQGGDCALNAVPVLTKAAQPTVMLPDEAKQLFRRLTSISFGVKVMDNGNIVPVRP